MLKKLGLILLLALAAGWASAQTTTIQLVNVTDSDGTVWNNGSWKIDFNPNPNSPSEGLYNQNGTPLNPTITHQQGLLSNVGSASFSVYDSSTITPVGSGWKLTVCPNASSPCGVYIFSSAGASNNVTSGVNGVIKAPRFTAKIGAYGYNSTEAQALNQPGATYWDVTQGCQNFYNPSTLLWACTSASGAIPAGPSFAVNFANAAVTNFQGDSVFTYTPSTHSLVSPSVNAIRDAQGYQSGGGNNGIANVLTNFPTNPFILADPTYSTTEAPSFGGGGMDYFGPVLHGPKSTDPQGELLDLRYGVPQYYINNSIAFDNRHNSWPAVRMSYIGNSNITGTFANIAGTQMLDFDVFTGTHNFYNDKVNIVNSTSLLYKYSEGQIGAAFGNSQGCYGNGDCVGIGADTFGAGGPNTAGDEGLEGIRQNQGQSGQVFSGTLNSISIASDGTTTLTHTTLHENGTQGEGRLAIDTTKKYNTGYISGFANSGGNEYVTCAGGCDWDGTYGTGVQTLLTAAVANPISNINSFPQSNTVISVVSSTGFTIGNLACIFDYDYECAKITNVGVGTVTLATVRKPHPINAYVTTGGMAGYAIEFEADTVSPSNMNGVAVPFDTQVSEPIRNAIPIMYNVSGNKLYFFQGGNFLPGFGGGYNGREYLAMAGSGGTCTPTVAGGVLTAVTLSGGSGYTGGPPQITFTGTWTNAPSAQVTGYGSAGVSSGSVISGGSGIAAGLTCSVVTSNPYDIYPAAKTIQVYNTTTGAIDGSLITQPWPTILTVGDNIEQPHYFWQHVAYDPVHSIGQYFPALPSSAHGAIGHYLAGIWQGNDIYYTVNNQTDPSLYAGYPAPVNILGRNQLLTMNAFFYILGAARWDFYVGTPPFASNSGYNPSVIFVDCLPLSCANWTSAYNVLALNGATKVNTFNFNPSTEILTSTIKTIDFSRSILDLGTQDLTGSGGFISQAAQNWNPNSNNMTGAGWGCDIGVSISQDATVKDPFLGNLPVWKVVSTVSNKGCGAFTTTPFPNGIPVSGSVWVYTAGGVQLCANIANVNAGPNSCVIPAANTWVQIPITSPGGPNPSFNTKGTYVYINGATGTWWMFNAVAESGSVVSQSQLINTTASSITSNIPVNQIFEAAEFNNTVKFDGQITIQTLSGCLQASSGVVSSTGSPCGSSTGSGITQLTGDVLAGPGSGSVVATLPNVNANTGTWGDSTHVATVTVNAKGQVTGVSSTAIAFPSGISNTQISIGSFTIPANTCYGSTGSTTPATATITGLATTSVPFASFSSNPSAITGWGTTGGLSLEMWPSAANTVSYLVCNATAASITGGAITFNIGAR